MMISTIALWLWLLVGCQISGSGEKPNEATPRPPSTNTPAAKGPEGKIPAGSEAQIELAKQNLANRLGTSTESITVASVEEVEWPDSSLGCPEPGKMYAQIVTPGYRIMLQAGGKDYEYHTDKGKNVVLCSR